MFVKKDGIHIGTISGGVVNFGGSAFNSPITVAKTLRGAGEGNTGTIVISNIGRKI